MRLHTIEFCSGNLRSNNKVWRGLESYGNIELIDYGCLGYCGNCYEEAFAIVNGILMSSTDPDQLLEKIITDLELRK
ncbi:DUF1450 domain-containing protein [Guptibacillus algicola]|uniref:DUF1450 domain-containing protein n=1 Tax=Guptibacillus algicola TaxID=225844 RepID=UPI001CD1E197|nr:DUF1450 domain-containing protein [Alkalihalobacillus algicola]MCA0986636.1 DUF1450 domain-containing protein [Alkalihalobacillus algicola]